MKFKDIKIGDILFLFDKEMMTIEKTKVKAKGTPTMKPAIMKLAADYTLERPSGDKIFNLEEEAEHAISPLFSVATSIEDLMTDVEEVMKESERELSRMDYHSRRKEAAMNLLNEHSPEYKAKTETNARLAALEKGFEEIKSILLKKYDNEN